MPLGVAVGVVIGAAGSLALQTAGSVFSGGKNGSGQALENGGSASVEASKLQLMPGAATINAGDIKISLESSSSLVSALLQQLWPQINKIAIKIVKDSVEPMFAETLPGPFKKMHFQTLDLGSEPLKLENFVVHPVIDGTLRIELEINWDSNCDILLTGIPGGNTIGVKTIKLRSRMLILCRPILDEAPVVSSAQIAFINHPFIDLDFLGLANVADWVSIRPMIDKGIKDGLSGSLVLPQRTFVKVDPKCNFIQAYQRPIGVLRVKLVKGRDFPVLSFAGGLMKDIPDVYCKLELGGKQLVSEVILNNSNPEWNATFDFLLCDFGQVVDIHAFDKDKVQKDSDLGSIQVAALELLKNGGKHEFTLACQPADDKRKKLRGNKPTSIGKVSLECEMLPLCKNIASITAEPKPADPQAMTGMLIIYVSKLTGLPVPMEKAASFVKVKLGPHTFQTPTVKYNADAAAAAEATAEKDEGVAKAAYEKSILDPEFNSAFQIPIFASDTSDPQGISFELMNGKESLGKFNITPDVYIVFKDELSHSTSNVGGAVMYYGVEALGLDLGKESTEDLKLKEEDTTKTAPLEIDSKPETTATTDASDEAGA